MLPKLAAIACMLAAIALAAESRVKYRTVGGSWSDSIAAVAVDRDGNIIVAGNTTSRDFPTVNAFQPRSRKASLVESRDNGATWSALPLFVNESLYAVAVDPFDANRIYAGGERMIYRSTDGGRSWLTIDPVVSLRIGPRGAPVLTIRFIRPDPYRRGRIYAGGGGGCFRTDDGGDTWVLLPVTPYSPTPRSVAEITLDPFTPGRLFVLTGVEPSTFSRGGVLYRSDDAGENWAFVRDATHIEADPFKAGAFYLSSFGCSYSRTTDFGKTWVPITRPQLALCAPVLADPTMPGSLYSIYFNQIAHSTDSGGSWVVSAMVNPPQADLFYVFGKGAPRFFSGKSYSTDGIFWSRSDLTVNLLSVTTDPSNPSRLLGSALQSTATDAFVAKLDPSGESILFSTLLGGHDVDTATSVAVDPLGNIYVAGVTQSESFPVSTRAVQRQHANPGTTFLNADAFVAKLSPTGELQYSTYLGASGSEESIRVAADASGSAVISGLTHSPDFPLVNALQGGLLDRFTNAPFVARLAPDGSRFIYCTLFGTSSERINGIAADSQGDAFITGSTIGNAAFPGILGQPPQNTHAFLTRLTASGAIVFSRRFGGSLPGAPSGMRSTAGVAVATGSGGATYVTGTTTEQDFPVTAGSAHSQTPARNCAYPGEFVNQFAQGIAYGDVFVTKFDDQGQILYSTFWGGGCRENSTGLAVDSDGSVIVTGRTNSVDVPIIDAVESGPRYGLDKAFVFRLSPAGDRFTFSSYIDGGNTPSVALQESANVVVGGNQRPREGFSFAAPVPPLRPVMALVRPPAPAPLAIQAIGNAFIGVSGPVSAQEIFRLSFDGPSLPGSGPDLGFNPSAKLPTVLATAQVLFDGQPAPLIRAAGREILGVTPAALAYKTETLVELDVGGQRSNPLRVGVVGANPALLPVTGAARGAIQNSSLDLSNLTPANSAIAAALAYNDDGTLNSETNPARYLSRVRVYLTGAGVGGTIGPDGEIATSPAQSPFGLQPVPGFVHGLYETTVTAFNGATFVVRYVDPRRGDVAIPVPWLPIWILR